MWAFSIIPHISEDHLHPVFINLCVTSLDMRNRPRASLFKTFFPFLFFFFFTYFHTFHTEISAVPLRTQSKYVFDNVFSLSGLSFLSDVLIRFTFGNNLMSMFHFVSQF